MTIYKCDRGCDRDADFLLGTELLCAKCLPEEWRRAGVLSKGPQRLRHGKIVVAGAIDAETARQLRREAAGRQIAPSALVSEILSDALGKI